MVDRWETAKSKHHETLKLLGEETKINFLTRNCIEIIHEDMVNEFGGIHGIRDNGLLESALNAPINIAAYQNTSSVNELGAILAARIIQDHPFLDGNKRTGLISLVTFLDMNGLELESNHSDTLSVIQSLSAHKINETDFCRWVDRHTRLTPETPEPTIENDDFTM